MNAQLSAAVDRFVARASASGARGHISATQDLAAFDNHFPGVMPIWYRELLETAPLGNITFLASPHLQLGWTPWGHFRDAKTLVAEIAGVFPDDQLTKTGYLPIGTAGDGDCWVIRSSSTADEAVFLCRATYLALGDPARSKNCLLFHSGSFAAFLDDIAPNPIVT